MSIERLLSVADVADITGVSPDTIRRAIRAGDLNASKLRGCIRIRPEDVALWVDASRIPAPDDDTPHMPYLPSARPTARTGRRLTFTERAKRAA